MTLDDALLVFAITLLLFAISVLLHGLYKEIRREKERKRLKWCQEMRCRNCDELCVYLGGTVGGTQLYGCPKCKQVYYAER
ncbi:MAG: hypothetical protein QW161_06725 [Candidatus Bathyarchaeia archaeon]